MAKFLSKKILITRLIVPSVLAALTLFSLLFLLRGPVLGPVYDFLLARRPPPPISQELLLIETEPQRTDDSEGGDALRPPPAGRENVISPALAGAVVMTLAEMSASALIIQAPILGVSVAGAAASSDLIFRFEEEFKTINGNVKNLFDGIRLGSIAPQDAPHLVDDVVELNTQGKERLLESVFSTGGSDAVQLEKAFAAFGGAHIPVELEVSIISSGGSVSGISSLYSSGYSLGMPDGDGKFRRIVPVLAGEKGNSEHIVWSSLKKRYKTADFPVALDENGAILFEMPKNGHDFREIPLEIFLEYDDLDKTLYHLLVEGVSLANSGGVLPDQYPAFLYENAQKMREELFLDTKPEQKGRWIAARNAYFTSLSRFFDGTAEKNIRDSFDRLIVEENLDETGIGRIESLRDGELQKYTIAREIWQQLKDARRQLENSLAGSFCILGNSRVLHGEGTAFSGTDISAVLANSILTGKAVMRADENDTLLYTIIAALAVILILLKTGPLLSLFSTLALSAVIFVLFSYRFVVSGQWLDPFIPAGTVLAASFASLVCSFAAWRGMAVRLRRCFGSIMSASTLRKLIKTTKPLPEKNKTVPCTIIAVYNPNLNSAENKADPLRAAEASKEFRAEVCAAFFKEGGVVVSGVDDTILVSFGSPLERLVGGDCGAEKQVNKAAHLAASLPPPSAKSVPWCFGLDYGECGFDWLPPGGYTAFGKAVIRARLLARVCVRYKVKALAGEAAKAKMDASRIKELSSKKDARQCTFFEITAPNAFCLESPLSS
jgi:hypothetical protein